MLYANVVNKLLSIYLIFIASRTNQADNATLWNAIYEY